MDLMNNGMRNWRYFTDTMSVVQANFLVEGVSGERFWR